MNKTGFTCGITPPLHAALPGFTLQCICTELDPHIWSLHHAEFRFCHWPVWTGGMVTTSKLWFSIRMHPWVLFDDRHLHVSTTEICLTYTDSVLHSGHQDQFCKASCTFTSQTVFTSLCDIRGSSKATGVFDGQNVNYTKPEVMFFFPDVFISFAPFTGVCSACTVQQVFVHASLCVQKKKKLTWRRRRWPHVYLCSWLKRISLCELIHS